MHSHVSANLFLTHRVEEWGYKNGTGSVNKKWGRPAANSVPFVSFKMSSAKSASSGEMMSHTKVLILSNTYDLAHSWNKAVHSELAELGVEELVE